MTNKHDDDTSIRFSLLELDDAPRAPIAHTAPPPVRVAPPPPPVGIGAVDARRAAVARAERELANELTGSHLSGKGGEGPGATFYDEGTVVMNPEAGLKSRRDWQARPLARAAAAAHSEVIAAERRLDYPGIPLAQVRIDEHGNLSRANGGLRFNEWSWSQVRNYAPDGALRNNFNAWLAKSDRSLLLRTRDPDPATKTRELFAALSHGSARSYAVADGDKVLRDIVARMPDTARADVKYERDSTELCAEISLHNPYTFEDEIAVGRVHQVGIRVRTADNGGRRLSVKAFVERVRCINYTIVPHTWAKIERRHTGDAGEIAELVARLARKAGTVAQEFGAHWLAASQARAFEDVEGEEGAREAFGTLVSAGLITLQGVTGNALIDSLVDAWKYEPGSSHQAINRAITRAAQSDRWSLDQQESLEETAGELLYNRVWTQL